MDCTTAKVETVSIYLQNHCFGSEDGSNSSLSYSFPQVKMFYGSQCNVHDSTETLNTDCNVGSVWLGYSAPTAAPTAIPSISLTPTTVPTFQSQPQFNVAASMLLDNLANSSLTANAKIAITATVCASMNLAVTECEFVSASFRQTGVVTARKLAHSSNSVSAMAIGDPIFAAKVIVSVKVALIDHPEYNGNVAALIADIEQSIANTDVSEQLVTFATFYDALELLFVTAATIEPLNNEDILIQLPPTQQPTVRPSKHHSPNGGDNLSDGQISGIVIGVFAGTVLLLAGLYHLIAQYRRSTFTPDGRNYDTDMVHIDINDDFTAIGNGPTSAALVTMAGSDADFELRL